MHSRVVKVKRISSIETNIAGHWKKPGNLNPKSIANAPRIGIDCHSGQIVLTEPTAKVTQIGSIDGCTGCFRGSYGLHVPQTEKP